MWDFEKRSSNNPVVALEEKINKSKETRKSEGQSSGRRRGRERKGLNHRSKWSFQIFRWEREREIERDKREWGHVCMQVIVHQNAKRPLHTTMKKRAKALCTDWTAYRALHVNRQIIPTGCSTQSTLLAKPPKGTRISRAGGG